MVLVGSGFDLNSKLSLGDSMRTVLMSPGTLLPSGTLNVHKYPAEHVKLKANDGDIPS